MGLITWIKAVRDKLFKKEIESKFDVDTQLSDVMESWIDRFYSITEGKPPWNDPEDDIESINFAGFIDDITAGLVVLDLGIEMPETPRGEYLKRQADYVLQVIQDKVSEGLGNCGIMFKPNGKNVDYVEPGNFAPTETDSNGNILGCVFYDQIKRKDWVYTKLEWHRFEGEGETRVYHITNKAYKRKAGKIYSRRPYGEESGEYGGLGEPCSLSEAWPDLEEEVAVENIEYPLFAYFKNPVPNRLDRGSALGVPIWHDCLKELRDLDVAWSRKSGEVEDSKHMTFVPESAIRYADAHNIKLPRFIRSMETGANIGQEEIHEHVATMLTDQRITDINSILAMISTKCGFSQGFFVLDEKTGVVTATQIESDDQSTIRTIKNIRDALRSSMDGLFYALNIMADLYSDTPPEDWTALKEQITYSFGDITYNYEEDKASWWKYRIQGDVPAWMYYQKFEKMSEDEARAMVEEAKAEKPEGLFDEE